MTLLPSDLPFPPRREPAVTDIHVPHQPYWWCRKCRRDWPCAFARPALQEQLDEPETRTQTLLYLADQYQRAQHDLGGDGPDLWKRFVELRDPEEAS